TSSVSGNFINASGAQLTFAGGGAQSVLNVGGTFNNAGTVQMAGNNDVLNVTGLFTNSGAVTIGPGETLNALGGYTQTAGTTTVPRAGTLAPPAVNINGGTLQGTGSLIGSTTISGGASLLPGLSTTTPGTMTFGASLNIGSGSSGTWIEVINSNVAGTGYGVLN